MKKNLLIIGIILFFIIDVVLLFCCIKATTNKSTPNSDNDINIDNFIDVDLAKQLHKQLDLGNAFSAVGFEKDKNDIAGMSYYFGKSTYVSITFKKNKVSSFSITIDVIDSKFNREELLSCLDKLLTKNWFYFSKKEKEDIRLLILDEDVSKTINDINIHTTKFNDVFYVRFSQQD